VWPLGSKWLLVSIRVWKLLTMTNTPAFYVTGLVTTVKSLIVQGPGAKTVNKITHVIVDAVRCCYVLSCLLGRAC
jgi:hypothetical protein